jgi:hypothetical protein
MPKKNATNGAKTLNVAACLAKQPEGDRSSFMTASMPNVVYIVPRSIPNTIAPPI